MRKQTQNAQKGKKWLLPCPKAKFWCMQRGNTNIFLYLCRKAELLMLSRFAYTAKRNMTVGNVSLSKLTRTGN